MAAGTAVSTTSTNTRSAARTSSAVNPTRVSALLRAPAATVA